MRVLTEDVDIMDLDGTLDPRTGQLSDGSTQVGAAPSRRRAPFRWRMPLLLAVLALATSGCAGENCLAAVTLQAPGITPVIAQYQGPPIASIFPYADASGHVHALLLGPVTNHNVRLTSSGQANDAIADMICGNVAAWSSDHRYLACSTGSLNQSGAITALSVSALSFAADGTVQATPTGATATLAPTAPNYLGAAYISASWLPGSRLLTAVRSVPTPYPASGDCSLDFYLLDSTASQLHLTGRLSPQESNTACAVLQAAWSPDGQFLALLTAAAVQVLPRAALPAAVFAATSRPVTTSVTPRTLAAGFTEATGMAWRPDAQALTVADLTTLQQVTVPDGQRTTLLHGTSQPSGANATIGPLAWWPDGHHLLFAYGYGEGVEYILGASTVWVKGAGDLQLVQPRAPVSAGNSSCASPPPVVYQVAIA